MTKISDNRKREAVKASGGRYEARRHSTYFRPGAGGPAGTTDHGAPGWVLPGRPARMTLDEAFEQVMDMADEAHDI